MARYRSREAETEDVNQRRLRRGAVKRTHIGPWAVGADEIAPGVIGESHLGPQIINETHLHPTTVSDLRGAGQLLVMSATADSIASGGDYVVFGSIVAQTGFAEVAAAGVSWVHPITGVYVLHYEHEWDTYTAGGTAELEIDGVVPAGGTIGTGTDGQAGQGTILYETTAGSVGKVKVTQSSGVAKTCDATVRVGITDPTLQQPPEWIQLFGADTYDLTVEGGYWWTTEGNSGLTVSKRDSDATELFTFEASAVDVALHRVRGIGSDGTNLWVVGEANNVVAKYSTAGVLLSQFDPAWVGETGLHGVAFNGTDVWVIGNLNKGAKRYTTAGVLQQTIALPAVELGGAVVYNSLLYIVDTTNSQLLVYNSAGASVGTIDVSGAVTGPTGVWITEGGILYVSKDAVGVYRRAEAVV